MLITRLDCLLKHSRITPRIPVASKEILADFLFIITIYLIFSCSVLQELPLSSTPFPGNHFSTFQNIKIFAIILRRKHILKIQFL
jgi:hypothetical protein